MNVVVVVVVGSFHEEDSVFGYNPSLLARQPFSLLFFLLFISLYIFSCLKNTGPAAGNELRAPVSHYIYCRPLASEDLGDLRRCFMLLWLSRV